METNLELKLKSINNNFPELLNAQNNTDLENIQNYCKNTASHTHEEQLTEEAYYQSPQEQIEALERKLKNNVKLKISDFQAYLHFTKKEDLNQEFHQLLKMLTISEKHKEHSSEFFRQTNIEALKILDLSVQQLCKVTCSFLEEKSKCRQLINQKQLQKLIKLISQEYNITSYHNFTHAVSVMMLLRQIQQKLNLSQHFSQLQLFIAEMAALAHDLGHKGLSAYWEVKTKSNLAFIYHSESLLEKMHIAKFFRMLKEHKELDFFQAIKDSRQREASKKEFVRLILGTDMAKHFKSVQNIQNKTQQNKQNLILDNKQEVLELIFHAADIGNPCMEFQEYMNWSILLAFEFNAQALRQEKANIQISPGFGYHNLESFLNGQIGFIKTFCLPLWKTIAVIYPSSSFYLEKIKQNQLQIESRIDELKKKVKL